MVCFKCQARDLISALWPCQFSSSHHIVYVSRVNVSNCSFSIKKREIHPQPILIVSDKWPEQQQNFPKTGAAITGKSVEGKQWLLMKALICQKVWRHFTPAMPLQLACLHRRCYDGHEAFKHSQPQFGTQPTIIDEPFAALNRASKRDMMFWMCASLGGFPLPQKKKNNANKKWPECWSLRWNLCKRKQTLQKLSVIPCNSTATPKPTNETECVFFFFRVDVGRVSWKPLLPVFLQGFLKDPPASISSD